MRTLRRKGFSRDGLRTVAVFEGIKGMLVLFVGFGLLAFIHKDLHLAAEQLVRHLHINPARHYPRIFTDLANHLNDAHLWPIALSALAYSIVRFIEAFGLWNHRQWAEWFGLLTGAMYIPLELFEMLRRITWPRTTVLVVNTAIVGYLAYVLSRQNRKDQEGR